VAAGALYDEHSLIDAIVRQNAPDDSGGDHEVVAMPVSQRPELTLERPGALLYEDHFVPMRVPIPVLHRLSRSRD